MGNFPYFATFAWEEALICVLIAVISYGCGIAHGIIGTLLIQYYKKESMPTTSTQTTNESRPMTTPQPAVEIPTPPPPMPQTRASQRIQWRVPSSVAAGFTNSAYAYHDGDNPCPVYRDLQQHNKNTKRFTPCKVCWPTSIPRTG